MQRADRTPCEKLAGRGRLSQPATNGPPYLIAYVYRHADPRDAETAKSLTLDGARRIASNIAKLPSLLTE